MTTQPRIGEDIIFSHGIGSEEDVFEDGVVSASVSAGSGDEPDSFSGAENRVIVDMFCIASGTWESGGSGTAPLFIFDASVGAVDGEAEAFVWSGEIGGIIQEYAVGIADICNDGVMNVDFGIEDAHVGPIDCWGEEEAFSALERVEMIVMDCGGGAACFPSGHIGAAAAFFAFRTVTAVLF